MTTGPLNLAFKERNTGGPYSRPIKCKVVAAGEPVLYRGKDESERASLTVAVSDGTTVKKMVAYDASKFKYLKKKDSPESKRRVTDAVTDGKAELLPDVNASVISNAELLGAGLATPDDLIPGVKMATAAGPLQLTLNC